MSKISGLNLTSVSWFFKQHINLVFTLVLLGLMVMEGFTVFHSVQLVLHPAPDEAPIVTKGVRVDFKTYDAVIKRVNNAGDFAVPPQAPLPNPFYVTTPQ